MKLLVLVRQVLDPRGVRYSANQRRLVTEEAACLLEPADHEALELAARLRDGAQAATFDVLALGLGSVEEVAKEALGFGPERLLVCQGPSLADGALAAQALAPIIAERLAPGLLLCGSGSLEWCLELLGPLLAAELDWPCVTEAVGLRLAGEGLVVSRVAERGLETFEVALPAVVTTARGAFPPRVVSPLALMKALRRAAIERIALPEPAAPPKFSIGSVVGLADTRPRRQPEVVKAISADEAAELIVAALVERGLA